jgi:hypothetical protein
MKGPKRIFLERENSEKKKIFLAGKRGGGVQRTATFEALLGWRSWN